MTIERYKALKKTIAEELNIHEIIDDIGEFEGRRLRIHFFTDLGYKNTPDRLWLEVKGQEWGEDSPTLQKIITEYYL